MFNKVILTGNLSKDITLKSNSNITIASSTIAVNRKLKNQNGDTSEEVLFIDITFFGRQAQIANQYLNKGSKVLIEGRLKYDTWQDQNGQNRSKHSVVVESMEMLGGQNTGANQNNQSPNTNNNQSHNQSNNSYNESNDEIPF
ncbi:single-stranded DNA-binding protein [Campylobacter devanensis]|uniref:single-stranded DNA-binding protein n=1 Tax=Campylobacter devanensis TaxID=3161138 RepID=UPI000A33697D|nr:single-stranded DNA-binding protein [Campylobacter sp. P0187]